MRNEYHNLKDTIEDRTTIEKELLCGNIPEAIEMLNQDESFEKRRDEKIQQTLTQLPLLKDVMKKFKLDNFYLYIFAVPYFNLETKSEVHMCVQDKLAGMMNQDNIATNFHSEPGYWYFDLLIPYRRSFTEALEETRKQIKRAYLDTPDQLNALTRCTPLYNINKAFDIEENFIVWRIMTEAPTSMTNLTKAHYSYAWNRLSLPRIFPILGASKGPRAEVGKMIVYEAEKETAEKSLDNINKIFGDDFDIIKETITINWDTINELGLAANIHTNDIAEIRNVNTAKKAIMRSVAETIEPVTIGDKKVTEKEMLNKFVGRISDILGEPHRPPVLYKLSEMTTDRDQEKYKILSNTLSKEVRGS